MLGISSTCDHVMEDEEDLIERATNSAKSRSPSIGESLYASTILSIEVFLYHGLHKNLYPLHQGGE